MLEGLKAEKITNRLHHPTSLTRNDEGVM
jgi:hypothetical protein